jgi:NAD(P)H dehydrogenase (quinone)
LKEKANRIKMILITGAAGKTGRAVLKSLIAAGADTRVLTHTPEQGKSLLKIGAKEAICGEINNIDLVQKAVRGVEKVYHICPNVSPDEFQIGRELISAARDAKVSYFVYHSVLHPQVEAMPHHWQKMRVEELLFTSGMDFSVIQPCAYMQNIIAGWRKIVETGIYSIPYSTSARISVVDLEDIGSAASKVLVEDKYRNGIYECSGPMALSQIEVANVIGEVIQQPVRAEQQDLKSWVAGAQKNRMDSYQIDTLSKMFAYYDKFGLVGNPRVLENIIGKPPRTFKDFFAWYNQNSLQDL